MSRIAYVNGRYLPRREATVHVEDRGYQFSDGVYEVCEVRDGRLIDERRHVERLQRSLGELRIRLPMSPAALGVVMRETIRRNRVHDGIVYLQMTSRSTQEIYGERGTEAVDLLRNRKWRELVARYPVRASADQVLHEVRQAIYREYECIDRKSVPWLG